MHRLRHPIRSITEPYGKAGLLVAILALVLATTGAAFAAAGLSGKQKKEVEKLAKKFAGKPGAPGAAGPAGPAGAAGATGKEGPQGKPGEAGKNGTNGKSVEVKEIVTGQPLECEERGGALVEKEGEPSSAVEVCNGPQGEPWTAGGTLPKGAEEKGVWDNFGSKEGESRREVISFGIPLKTKPKPELVTAPTVNCPGTVIAPTAKPGYLCFYDRLDEPSLAPFASVTPKFEDPETLSGGNETGPTGTIVTWTTHLSQAAKEEEFTQSLDRGTWAVAGD